MGLRLTISLDKDIRELNQFFSDLKFKAITKSARQGLNRAATRTRTFAAKEMRKRLKILARDLKGSKVRGKKGFITVNKAKGNNIAALEARVNFSGIPLPLILFIVGDKTPEVQKVGNANRSTREFEIKKGSKAKRKGLFIQKAKSGGERYLVFRRKDKLKKSKGFAAQSAPSVAEMLRKKTALMRKIERRAMDLLQKEYNRALAHNLSKIKL